MTKSKVAGVGAVAVLVAGMMGALPAWAGSGDTLAAVKARGASRILFTAKRCAP